MTYGLALNYGGMTAIVTDTQVTFSPSVFNDKALKSGLLFPGCIFTLAGNSWAGARFLQGARDLIQGDVPLGHAWDIFLAYVNSTSTGAEPAFQVLMSTRVSGAPELYCYDYRLGLIRIGSGLFVSIGSGRRLLDPITPAWRRVEQ